MTGFDSRLTLAFQALSIDTGTSNHNIVDDGEDALATNPLPISRFDSGIVEDGRLVKVDATVSHIASRRDLIGMEVVEARPSVELIRLISQDIGDGVRGKKDVGLGAEI